MNRTTDTIIIAVLMTFSAALCVAGISYGLPSERRSRSAFESPKYFETLATLINERRNRIYTYYSTYSNRQILHNRLPTGSSHTVDIEGKKTTITDAQLDTSRSFLLQSDLPDESHTLKAVYSIRYQNHDFNPHFFIYGGMFLYPIGAVIETASLAGAVTVTSDAAYYLRNPRDAARLFIIPKLFSTLLFALSIPVLFFTARRVYGRPAALLAATLYAFVPVTIVYAHLLKPHVSALFWATCCLWASSMYTATFRKRWIFLAGIFAGFSGGAFIYASAILLFPLGLAIFSSQKPRVIATHLASVFMAGAAGFFISNPYWILDYKSVIADISHISTSPDAASTAYRLLFSPYWFTQFFANNLTLKGVSLTTGLLFYAGFIHAVRVRTLFDKAALFFLIPFLLFSALSVPAWWQSDFHMSLAAAPIITLLAARWLVDTFSRYQIPAAARNAVLCVVIGFPFLQCCFYSSLFICRFTKETASEWINSTVPARSSFGTTKVYFGGFGGYPALPVTKYVFFTQPPNEASTDYYLTYGFDKDIPPNPRYTLEKTFARNPSILDKLFSARILPILNQHVSVYKRIS